MFYPTALDSLDGGCATPPNKIPEIGPSCVACGTCVALCPVAALSVPMGLRAVVDAAKCVGCGKCGRGCPAGVVEVTVREGGGHA